MVDSSYNYTRISGVSTPPDFSSLVPNIFANAAINDSGTITYEGFVGYPTSHLPPSIIFSGNGNGAPTPLISNSSYQFVDNNGKTYSDIFFSSSSNNSGTTVFGGAGYIFGTSEANAGGPSGVFSVTNGTVSTVAYSSTPFTTVAYDPNQSLANPANDLAVGSFVSAPGINNQGTIAYIAGSADGTSDIYTKSSSGVLTKVADTGSQSGFSNFLFGGLDVGRGEGPFAKYTLPSINDSGTVAFNADLKAGGKGIFTSNNGTINSIVAQTANGPYSYLSLPTINDSGTVAFNAGFTTGGAAILESNNGILKTIADTSSNSIFSSFASDVALNQKGDLTFLANLKDGSTAIYTWSPTAGFTRVIAVGDSLDGSTVTGLFAAHDGLNNNGQIAFDATLATGGLEVFRADPAVAVPEPSNISSLAVAVLCIISYYWRRRKSKPQRATA